MNNLLEVPSPLWQWIGIIVGILAFLGVIVSIPMIFQMFWGRPNIKVELQKRLAGETGMLVIYLQNQPVKNMILQKLGVSRDTIQSLAAHFLIREFGSGKIIDPIRTAIIFSNDEPPDTGKTQIMLPPTFGNGAAFAIMSWDTQKNKAFIPGSRLRQPIELSPGNYQAEIALTVNGKPIPIIKQFVIGQTADEAVWTQPTN